MLKPQFGLIADQVAAMNLVAGRGGNEMTKLRILREGIGSLKQALEIAAVRVKEQPHGECERAPRPRRTPGALASRAA